MKITSSQQDGGDGDAGEIALLFAVFALSSTHPGQSSEESNPSDFQSYYQIASDMLTHIEGECQLDVIQAMLLLSMIDIENGDWETASILVGRATRMILLWHSGKHERIAPARESGSSALAKRVVLGCFILDTIIATYLQSLPHLRTLDMQGFLDFDEDGPDEWEQWVKKAQPSSTVSAAWPTQGLSHRQAPIRALSTFKEYAKLISVLNDGICKSFGKLVASQTDQENFVTKLEFWTSNLSRHNKIWIQDTSQAHKEPPPPTANLHLTYSIVLLYLQLSTSFTSGAGPITSNSRISSICDAALTSYKQAFGHYQWQGILRLLMRLGLHDHTAGEQSRYSIGQSDCLESDTTYQAASSMPHFPSDTQVIDLQPSLQELEMLPADSNFEQEANAASRLAFAMEEEVGRELRRGMIHAEPISGVFNPPEFPRERARDLPDDMSVDMPISMTTPFNNFHDGGTIESLLEELSAGNESDWSMTPSQFMYNLGFYDGEPNG